MIGQQTLLLRAGHIGPDAIEKRMAQQKEKMAAQADKPQKKGFMASMMEKADAERSRREGDAKKPPTGKRPPSQKRGSGSQRKPKKQGGKHGA
jgi:hypothetical protein